jgi:arsenate reductase
MTLPGPQEALVLLHNPRCSKSCAAKEILEKYNVTFDTRNYLENPLSTEELRELARRLGREPSTWTRKGEDAFTKFSLKKESDAEAWILALAEEPILMERPILVAAQQAVVGRPPENIIDLACPGESDA